MGRVILVVKSTGILPDIYISCTDRLLLFSAQFPVPEYFGSTRPTYIGAGDLVRSAVAH